MKMAKDEVLKGLKHCKRLQERPDDPHDECFDCPYRPDNSGTCPNLAPMLGDSISLIEAADKEVDPVQEIISDSMSWHCGACGDFIRFMDRYCHNCGRKVGWE